MVLGLKFMGKPTTYQNQVLERTKVLHVPRTQTYGEINYLSESSFGQNQEKVKAMKVFRKMVKHLITQQPVGAVHFWVICFRMITSYTAPSIQLSSRLFWGKCCFLRSALLCQTTLLSL